LQPPSLMSWVVVRSVKKRPKRLKLQTSMGKVSATRFSRRRSLFASRLNSSQFVLGEIIV
jgi:hypothetical protein